MLLLLLLLLSLIGLMYRRLPQLIVHLRILHTILRWSHRRLFALHPTPLRLDQTSLLGTNRGLDHGRWSRWVLGVSRHHGRRGRPLDDRLGLLLLLLYRFFLFRTRPTYHTEIPEHEIRDQDLLV
jgi:hypothetical protein